MATITTLGTHSYHEELTLNSQTCRFFPRISLLLKSFKAILSGRWCENISNVYYPYPEYRGSNFLRNVRKCLTIQEDPNHQRRYCENPKYRI